MPDQEFLASYAVDIDEDGVSRLQSILESNRSLAEALSSAFRRAYGDLSDFARGATASLPSLSSFIDIQSRAASTASQASQAIQTLTASYAGLRSAIPDQPLELSFSGLPSGSGDNGSSSGFSGWLSDISGSLSRLVALSGGSDAATGDGSGRSSSGSTSALSGETELSLNLTGASESLQQFMESLASSEAEIPASLNLTTAEESLAALQMETASSEAVLPLRLDRARAEATYTDLRRILQSPVSLSADTSRLLSSASAALASIRSSFSGTKLQLNAEINFTGGGNGSGGDGAGGEDTGTGGTGSGTGASGSGTGGGGNTGGNSDSDGPLVHAVRSATGGRFTRPTHVEVAEDGDTEYIIPVDKEPTAVPLLRQALTDLSQSARDAVLGDDPLSGREAVPSDLSLPSRNAEIGEKSHSDRKAATTDSPQSAMNLELGENLLSELGENPLPGKKSLPTELPLPMGETDAGDIPPFGREASLMSQSPLDKDTTQADASSSDPHNHPEDISLSDREVISHYPPIPDVSIPDARIPLETLLPEKDITLSPEQLSIPEKDSIQSGNILSEELHSGESTGEGPELLDRILPSSIQAQRFSSEPEKPKSSSSSWEDLSYQDQSIPNPAFSPKSLPEFLSWPRPDRPENAQQFQPAESASRNLNLSDLALPELTLPELSLQNPEEPKGEAQLLQLPFFSSDKDLEGETEPSSLPSNHTEVSPESAAQLIQPIASAPDPFSALTDLRFPDIHLPDMSSLLERLSSFSSTALDSLRSLPDLLSSAAAAAAPSSLTRNETKTVEAPVSINVTASGTDAELLAQSIYNAAQRHLVRTLRGAM